MPHILVVIASARKARVADKILEHVTKDLQNREGVVMTVADLKEINLPFFDNEHSPASSGYVATNPAVLAWAKLVSQSDAVVFLTPEYNHTINAIQKNAIDSLYKEWESKPVVMIGYGWSGASHSLVTLNEVLPAVKADFKQHPAQLTFMKDLNPDGTALDQDSVSTQIKTAIDTVA
jgi:NAD(P)H-dependent FMN reductase